MVQPPAQSTSGRQDALMLALANSLVVSILVGACVLAGFDGVNQASRERFRAANLTRAETLREIRALKADVAALKAHHADEEAR